MSGWHKPRWLYEALPYLYLGGGALTLIGVRNWGAAISSLLLISAGGVIWKMRHDYRLRHSSADGGGVRLREGGNPLVEMVWRPAFEVGHEVIDRQHRRLFAIGNELINAIILRKPKDDIELTLDDLVNDIAEHFRTEEEILLALGRVVPELHLLSHQRLLAEIRALREKFRRGELQVGELVGFVTYDVIAQHIIKEDLDLSPQV